MGRADLVSSNHAKQQVFNIFNHVHLFHMVFARAHTGFVKIEPLGDGLEKIQGDMYEDLPNRQIKAPVCSVSAMT